MTEPQSRPKKILIVEDNLDTADMLEASLQLQGYATIKIHHVGQAIQALIRDQPDLVMLDVMMPDVSGLEFCRYLRRDPRFDKVKIVIASARTQPEDLKMGLEAGASDYLAKPFSQGDLKAMLDRLLAD